MGECLVLVINLKRSLDRKAHIIDELERVGIQAYTFIDAIDGLELEDKDLEQYTITRPRKSKTEVACSLSHVQCYKALVASQADAAFILEDDVVLNKSLAGIIKHIDRFPAGWTLVQACKSH